MRGPCRGCHHRSCVYTHMPIYLVYTFVIRGFIQCIVFVSLIICKSLQITWMENNKRSNQEWQIQTEKLACTLLIALAFAFSFLGLLASGASPQSHDFFLPRKIQPEDRSCLSMLQSPPVQWFQPLLWNGGKKEDHSCVYSLIQQVVYRPWSRHEAHNLNMIWSLPSGYLEAGDGGAWREASSQVRDDS